MSTSPMPTSPSPAQPNETSCAYMLPWNWHTGAHCMRRIIQSPASGKGLVATCDTCGVACDLEACAIRVTIQSCGSPAYDADN